MRRVRRRVIQWLHWFAIALVCVDWLPFDCRLLSFTHSWLRVCAHWVMHCIPWPSPNILLFFTKSTNFPKFSKNTFWCKSWVDRRLSALRSPLIHHFLVSLVVNEVFTRATSHTLYMWTVGCEDQSRSVNLFNRWFAIGFHIRCSKLFASYCQLFIENYWTKQNTNVLTIT